MRRNKLNILIHFVWATWDRQEILTEDIQRRVYRYISDVCADDKCDVLAIGGMPDHVHLLVKLSNTATLAKMMHDVKGGSSRFITTELGAPFAWQGHYGAFSVSPRDKDAVIRYILNQKQYHENNTIWPHAEETFELVDQPIA